MKSKSLTFAIMAYSVAGTLVVSALPVIQFVYPTVIDELAGDHVAYQVSATGAGALFYQWYQTNSPLAGQTNSTLTLTNIQAATAGQYQVAVVDDSGIYVTNSVTLNVSPAPLPFYSTNLVVLRVGDGAQALDGATGNTIYLDQYTTAGVYVSTMMIPDEPVGAPYGAGSSTSIPGNPALLLPGVGNDYVYSGIINLSSNRQFLTFAAYCQSYPFDGADVTVATNGGEFWRGLALVTASGRYTLVYTNSGLYSGASGGASSGVNHTIRGAVTLDGTNFWTAGRAGSGGGIKYLNTQNTNYSGGAGIPNISTSSLTGSRVVQIFGSNLVYSDASGPNGSGLYICDGAPEPAAGDSATATLLLNEGGQPNDFAISPDGRTIYIADGGMFTNATTSGGGIQRWDTNSDQGGYSFSYCLPVHQTAGAQGLAVLFPTNTAHWGGNVIGAVLFATTFDDVLSSTVDNGPASAPAVLINAAACNEELHGIRFAPSVQAPPTITLSPPIIQTGTLSGHSFTFTWSGTSNAQYQIQSTLSLLPAQWTNLGNNLTETNSTMTVSESIGTNTQQFYRVMLFR